MQMIYQFLLIGLKSISIKNYIIHFNSMQVQ